MRVGNFIPIIVSASLCLLSSASCASIITDQDRQVYEGVIFFGDHALFRSSGGRSYGISLETKDAQEDVADALKSLNPNELYCLETLFIGKLSDTLYNGRSRIKIYSFQKKKLIECPDL